MKQEPFPYLQGINFYLSDHLPNKDEVEELIESSGGIILEEYKKKDKPVIICDKTHDRDLIKSLKAKWLIYNVDFILDSVFEQELDLDKVKAKHKIN